MDSTKYSKLELAGKKIVLTRASHQVKEFSLELKKYGAVPIEIPTIGIAPPSDHGERLRNAISHLDDYEWIIFTSSNGVDRFMSTLQQVEEIEGVKIAAIGPGTQRKLEGFNVSVDLLPKNHVAEGLLQIFPEPQSGSRVLIPRAEKARNILPDTLKELGWIVDDIPAYRTVRPDIEEGSMRLLEAADAIVFTSSSTAQNFVKMFGKENLPEVVISIGPVTTQAIIESGFIPTAEASPSSIEGIVESLNRYYSNI